jgi:hypothetical protein
VILPLVACLGAGICLALFVAVHLAVGLPRRVARMLAAEQARGEARAMIAKASLHEASRAEVAVIVDALRALLEEQTRRAEEGRAEADRMIASLRALVDRLAAEPPAAIPHEPALRAASLGRRPTPGSAPREDPPRSAPTLVSMRAIAEPTPRPAPPVEIERRWGP